MEKKIETINGKKTVHFIFTEEEKAAAKAKAEARKAELEAKRKKAEEAK